MERVTRDVDLVHLRVGDFYPLGIAVAIELAADIKSRTCRRGPDELHDGLVADEGLTSPVLRNECEQSVFDTVPFACSGRMMRDGDTQTCFIRKTLQLVFP